MRIGLELFGLQTTSRHRGIGRYCRNLAVALAERGRDHDFIFYAEARKPVDLIPKASNAKVVSIDPRPTLGDAFARLVSENIDCLDLLILGNPLELTEGYDVPLKHESNGLKIAAVVYDLIPLIFQGDYLLQWPGESYARRYLRALDRLKGYDHLFAISEATKLDIERFLQVELQTVVDIGTGADDPSLDLDSLSPDDESYILERFGHPQMIREPYLFTVAAADPRKNLQGLIEAFSKLPEAIRTSRKLVIGGALPTHERSRFEGRAQTLGIDGRIVFTGPVDDPTLRSLYRGCELFVFPSLYEGFGLPIVEALRQEALVVAGNNSSQVEAAGDAALLVNNADPCCIAEGIMTLLDNPTLAQTLKGRAREQARKFLWSRTADRLLEAIVKPASIRPRAALSKAPKTSRIAMVTPLPPSRSGIADYAWSLTAALDDIHDVDLFQDGRGAPFARFADRNGSCFDAPLLPRLAKGGRYDALLYQIGNSPHHFEAFDLAFQEPGVVVLHDPALVSFHYERAIRKGTGREGFAKVLAACEPVRFEALAELLSQWSSAPEAMVRALVAEGVTMNLSLVEQAAAVIVHSEVSAQSLRAIGVDVARKTFVIPHGADPVVVNPSQKQSLRSKLDLPGEALLIGVFGSVHPSKCNVETIEVFAELLKDEPSIDALLLIVGEEFDGGLVRAKVRSLGLESKVRFRGRPESDEFDELIATTDLGINLRRPPTHGETSGALLKLLSAKVPTIVTDVGSFGEFSSEVVRKVPWPNDREGARALLNALRALSRSVDDRERLGASALSKIVAEHRWPIVASRYAEVIRFHQERGRLSRPSATVRFGRQRARGLAS